MTCGRRPIEPDGTDTYVSLVGWVRDWGLKGDLLQAVDPNLQGSYNKEEVKVVLWLGLMCSQSRPEARPSVRQAYKYLNGDETLQEGAELVFADTDSDERFGSLFSMTWATCESTSTNSLQGGR